MNNLISYESAAKNLNDVVLTDYMYRLMLIARSIFEWEGLEELGIDEKWIERYLFSYGKCVFFKDPIKGYMVAQISSNGPLNYYNEPTTIRPVALNYTGETLVNNKDCVVIRNNDEMIPTSLTIRLFAFKLANIDRTIDTNIEQMKMPYIIKCSEKERLTFKNIMKQKADNEPAIYGDKGLDTTGLDVLSTEAPIVFKDLQLQKHMVWNECMTFLGINNANMDKKERLVDDEVQANNEQVEASFNVMLRARERACDQINEIFGTHISVKKRIQNTPKLEDLPKASEGGFIDE